MNYGRAIKIVRAAYGLSQTELAERLSITASHLSLIEAGKRQPSLRVLAEVSAALQVPQHLLSLLAAGPDQLTDDADPKYVTELARTLLRLFATAGSQRTLPIGVKDKTPRGRKPKKKSDDT